MNLRAIVRDEKYACVDKALTLDDRYSRLMLQRQHSGAFERRDACDRAGTTPRESLIHSRLGS